MYRVKRKAKQVETPLMEVERILRKMSQPIENPYSQPFERLIPPADMDHELKGLRLARFRKSDVRSGY